jgi:predicted alpha/beta hydrolase family esterase
LEEKIKNIYLYFSEDDPILPFKQYYTWKNLLKNSKFFIFQDRGHFSQPAFLELLENIDKK